MKFSQKQKDEKIAREKENKDREKAKAVLLAQQSSMNIPSFEELMSSRKSPSFSDSKTPFDSDDMAKSAPNIRKLSHVSKHSLNSPRQTEFLKYTPVLKSALKRPSSAVEDTTAENAAKKIKKAKILWSDEKQGGVNLVTVKEYEPDGVFAMSCRHHATQKDLKSREKRQEEYKLLQVCDPCRAQYSFLM